MNKRAAKVLVVDDDKIVLRAVTEILQREGYHVVAIDDAVEGLAAARDPSVDVAVLDIRMPHLSGMDLLRAIKQARPEVEVIMMTAFATVETAVEAVKAGAYDYLTKPFSNIDEVSLTVAKAAERKALKDRTRVLEEQLTRQGPVRGSHRPVQPDAGRLQARRDRQLLLAPPCSSRARAARARSWWRAPSTTEAPARTSPSSPSTARPSPRRCSSPSSSAT